MAFDIIVSPRSQAEIEAAIEYYEAHSQDAPVAFIASLQDAYDVLALHPFFRIRYKNVRAIKLKKFPYLLYYAVNESRSTVRILACFHGHLDPTKRPKR